MTTASTLADPRPIGTDPDPADELSDRMRHLEGEVAELRHTLSELAEIVVGDIKDRREAAVAFSTPMPDLPIPASLVPGGQATMGAVNALRRPWLLIDLLREVGTTLRMYMDPRYRVRRSTQLMVPLLFGLLIANYFFFNLLMVHIPVVTEIVERLVIIVLAVLLYKVIAREVARYRQVVAQAAVGTRAWKTVPAALINNDPETAAVAAQESP